MGVAVGGNDLKDALVQLEYGNIERPATEIINRNETFLLRVKAIGQGRGRRLIDQAEHIQPSHASGILCRLPLRIVKVCRER